MYIENGKLVLEHRLDKRVVLLVFMASFPSELQLGYMHES